MRLIPKLFGFVALLSLPLIAHAVNQTKATVYRGDCATVSTSTDVVGFANFNFHPDGSLDIQVSLKDGLENASYRAFVLIPPCMIVPNTDPTVILTTNGQGNGNIHVKAGLIPPGSPVAVQLVSPSTAIVPGPGPFADVVMTRFSDVTAPPSGGGVG